MARPIRAGLLARLASFRPRRQARPPQPPRSAPSRRRPYVRVALFLVLSAAVVGTLAAYLILDLLTGSLPPVSGRQRLPGIAAEVRIERDGLGIPTITASNRLDLAFATGYVHGQDRFFQMDLLRRSPAGELAEIAGPSLVNEDRRNRLHRFRARARTKLDTLHPAHRALLEHYAAGVEAGRKSLRRPPFEYLLLRSEPAPWKPEDTLLVVLGMFEMLQGGGIGHERTAAVLHDALPGPLADFLSPGASPWDAPLDGSVLPFPAIPGPEVLDLRKRPAAWEAPPIPIPALPDAMLPGSNNWAVAGKRTTHGGAIVANDMHLMLMVPEMWYRVSFVRKEKAREGGKEMELGEGKEEGKPAREYRATGVTLPGVPALVVGSTGKLAWGFTNTEGDWADLVLLEPDPTSADHYRTPEGPRAIEKVREVIHVKGAPDVVVTVEETVWGPVLDRDFKGRRRALRWVAHDSNALNLDLLQLEEESTVEGALAVGQRAGLPAQNFVVADAKGSIGWTVVGKIPRRVGFDGRLPVSWADGKCRWDGWLAPEQHPSIINPPEGILWTANNRTVGPPRLALLGLGTYDLGARARQIRDGLRARLRDGGKVSEPDMLAIQLDDRAIFLARWQELLLEVLQKGQDAEHEMMRREVRFWGGRSVPRSIGFHIVKRFRHRVQEMVLGALLVPCGKADRTFDPSRMDVNVEESVWQLLQQRPPHLLPSRFSSWDELLHEGVEGVRREIRAGGYSFDEALAEYAWGRANTVQVRHPLSSSVGPLADWLQLDMAAEALPGDTAHMPRIQGPAFGASQRMAVSPGREGEGYFHMPAGQSGHPLSPHYRDGQPAWAHGTATPFLPGPRESVLVLFP